MTDSSDGLGEKKQEVKHKKSKKNKRDKREKAFVLVLGKEIYVGLVNTFARRLLASFGRQNLFCFRLKRIQFRITFSIFIIKVSLPRNVHKGHFWSYSRRMKYK